MPLFPNLTRTSSVSIEANALIVTISGFGKLVGTETETVTVNSDNNFALEVIE